VKMHVRFCVVPLIAACMSTAGAQTSPEAAVSDLVKKFLAAEQAYDSKALAQLIREEYVEVSPAGEVDAHDQFLGFYAPDKKAEWPPVQTSEEQVRVVGDTAIQIVKFTYTMASPGGGAPMIREIRGSFTARQEKGTWKLLGAQYTGIRQPLPAK